MRVVPAVSRLFTCSIVLLLTCMAASLAGAADAWNVFPGGDGPGRGKQVVLISGDVSVDVTKEMVNLGLTAMLLTMRVSRLCSWRK